MDPKKPSWNKFARLKFSQKKVNKRLQKLEKVSLRHAHKFVMARLDRLSSVRRNVSMWIILVMALTIVSAAQWIVGSNTYTTTAYSSGGSYSEGVLGPLETLNPLFARTSAERSAAKLLFAGLYKYDTAGSIKGDLAEKVTVNDKETEYTVSLKKGVRWSDGHELTANDVIFTLKLLADPETNSTISGWRSITSQKMDDWTVKFVLPASYAPFMHALTFPIVPEHILKDVNPSELREHSFGKLPVTSGPFTVRMLQNVTSDGSKKVLYLNANKSYHHGSPKLDRFQLYVYPTQGDIQKALRLREITGTPELIYNDQSPEIKNLYSADLRTINNGVYALFNTSSQFLQSKPIRQALALSTDVNAVRKEAALSTVSLNGPILSQYTNDTKSQEYDVAKAQKLLDKAGWPVSTASGVRQKDDQKLQLSIVTLRQPQYEKIAKKMAEVWKNELKIEAEVRVVDGNDASQSILQTVLQPRNFDVLIYELALGGDPDVYAYWHSSQATSTGLNFSNFNNVIADDALSSGRSKRSAERRADRYATFTKIWRQDVPAVALYQPKLDYIHLKSAKVLGENTRLVSATDRYADVLYWATEKKSVYKTP